MVVLDGTLKSKALACLVFCNLLLVLAQGDLISEPPKLTVVNSQQRTPEQNSRDILKINRQTTVFLPRKSLKVFQFLDEENDEHNISVTIIPCSSAIKWSFIHITPEELEKKENLTTFFENEGTRWSQVDSTETAVIRRAQKGLYFLAFYSLADDTQTNVYITMDDRGPHELTAIQNSNLVLTPQRGRRLKVSWKPSSTNPHNTSYCLVVNTQKDYPSLCGAEEEGSIVRGLDVPVVINMKNFKLEKKWRVQLTHLDTPLKATKNDTLVVCVDSKTELTLTKLKKNVKYYFDLFAINNVTKLSTPYGKMYMTYKLKTKPISLIDGIQKSIDLRKLEGKALFQFKVNKPTAALRFYVIACGGAVDVKVRRKKGTWKSRTGHGDSNSSTSNSIGGRKGRDRLPRQMRVFGYKRFGISYPAEGDQYEIKVNAPNVDELTRIKYVEVFVTSQPDRKYPFPPLPKEPNLYEFKSQKSCNSVTIGWITARDVTVNIYCVAIWENRKFNYADLFRGYFQCDLNEVSRRKSFFLSSMRDAAIHRHCEMITREKKSITNYKIHNLKPGRSYTVQVTVTKKNGRTLSYKFLKVHTKHACAVSADDAKEPTGNESV